jgi:phospholipase C
MNQVVPVFRDTQLSVPDPPHEWEDGRLQFDNGRNDGFMRAYVDPHGASLGSHVMGYLTREELPFSYGLADAFASSDAWFSSVLGPTYPNRLYSLAGQSGGNTNNTPPPGGYTFPTIFDRLEEINKAWKYYYMGAPFLAFFHQTLPLNERLALIDEFFDDAKNGTLPPVAFIDPIFYVNDDHPPANPMLGQQFLAGIYAALADSPQWNQLLLVITYDEHGGFFDHVPPPKAADDRAALGFDQLGFRVPTLVAGPYVKQGYVSSIVREHSSIPAHIRAMFDIVEPLTARDAAAADLSDFIDEERLRRRAPRPAPKLPAIEVDEKMAMSTAFHDNRGDIYKAIDAGWIDKRFDRRSKRREDFYTIGDAIDRLGAGRLRRG